MALPTVKNLKHTINIAELKKDVKFRAMQIGEQKLLITAIEMGDENALVNAIIDIVSACTFGELSINKLPTHLVDFLYLKIFTKSSGEKSKASFTCNNPITVVKTEKVDSGEVDADGKPVMVDEEYEETDPCGQVFNVNIPLDRAEIIYPEGFEGSNIIMVDSETGIKLKVPTLEDYKKINVETDKVLEVTDDFIFACIDSVFTPDSVQVPGNDFSAEEFKEWMNSLEGIVIEKMDKFFKNMPVLGLDLPVHCPKCKKEHSIRLRGLEDFFV